MNTKGKILSTSVYFLTFSILVPSFFFLIGFSMDQLLDHVFNHPILSFKILGLLIMGIGLWFVGYATIQLWKKGRGLPVSSLPPKQFVKDGIYRFCRHPIYLGAIFIFAGFSLLKHSFWNSILCCPLFLVFFIVYVVCVEEPVLIERFGQAYIQYRNHVPLLFPLPFSGVVKKLFIFLLNWISVKVNHPLIIRYYQHLLFLSYGIWCGLGIMFGLMFLNGLLIVFGLSSGHIQILLITITISCLLGIRVIWMAGSLIHTKSDMKSIMSRVGFVSWGVLVGNLLSGIVFHMLTGRSYIIWLDCVFFSQMSTHFFGRLGCMFYGCCYGKETSSQFFIKYTHPTLKAVRENMINTSHIFPVQLFSAGYGLFIFLLILVLWLMKELPLGLPFLLTCVLYAIFRFLEEWYRIQKKVIWNLFSPAQIFCLMLLFIGMGSLLYLQSSRVVTYYKPLRTCLNIKNLVGLELPILMVLGLISIFVFSYHRKEIGKWV